MAVPGKKDGSNSLGRLKPVAFGRFMFDLF